MWIPGFSTVRPGNRFAEALQQALLAGSMTTKAVESSSRASLSGTSQRTARSKNR
jgi:hypothetical protein